MGSGPWRQSSTQVDAGASICPCDDVRGQPSGSLHTAHLHGPRAAFAAEMGGEDAGESRDGRMEARHRGLGLVLPALKQKHGEVMSVWKGCFRQGARSSVE